jgi:hypothetical protein
MKKNMFLIASSLTVVLMSCGSAKQAVKSLTAVEQPQPQVTVAAKEVNLSVEANREIVMPVVENAKPNPVKLVSFVNVEDLLDLNAGMSKQEVYAKLGKKPFDIISSQADGYTIVLYKYRKVHTILNDQNENKLGSAGDKEYGTKIEDAYVVFDKANKLELVVSKSEMESSKDVHKFHGALYGLTINGGKLSIKPIIEPEKH